MENNIVDLDLHRALLPRNTEWWDKWFLGLCVYIASASKDPSTQVGSVIVKSDKTILGLGYNGFPRNIKDTPERLKDRDIKYKYMVHAEANALHNCNSNPVGGILFVWPLPPCSKCAGQIIQAGIRRVVWTGLTNSLKERWEKDTNLSKEMLTEAGLSWVEYNDHLI